MEITSDRKRVKLLKIYQILKKIELKFNPLSFSTPKMSNVASANKQHKNTMVPSSALVV
jgi:hypothetical protein